MNVDISCNRKKVLSLFNRNIKKLSGRVNVPLQVLDIGENPLVSVHCTFPPCFDTLVATFSTLTNVSFAGSQILSSSLTLYMSMWAENSINTFCSSLNPDTRLTLVVVGEGAVTSFAGFIRHCNIRHLSLFSSRAITTQQEIDDIHNAYIERPLWFSTRISVDTVNIMPLIEQSLRVSLTSSRLVVSLLHMASPRCVMRIGSVSALVRFPVELLRLVQRVLAE